MKKIRMFTICFLCCLTLNASYLLADVGRVLNFEGDVFYSKEEGNKVWNRVTNGTTLETNNVIRTNANSQIEIQFSKDDVIHLDENTVFVVKEYQHNSKKAAFLLKVGRIWSAVNPHQKNYSRFEVHTPVAVASVKGTIYSVAINKDKVTNIEVLEGAVNVMNKNTMQSILVNSGYYADVMSSQRRLAAKEMPKEKVIEFENKVKDTYIPIIHNGGIIEENKSSLEKAVQNNKSGEVDKAAPPKSVTVTQGNPEDFKAKEIDIEKRLNDVSNSNQGAEDAVDEKIEEGAVVNNELTVMNQNLENAQLEAAESKKPEADVMMSAEKEVELKAELGAKKKSEIEAKSNLTNATVNKKELETKLETASAIKVKAIDEVNQRTEDDTKAKAELEAKTKAELAAKQNAEAEAKALSELEAKQNAAQEATAKAELEGKKKAEAEAKAKAELEAKTKSAEEAKVKAAQAAKAQAELEANQKVELEAKKKSELEAKKKAEAEAKKKAELESKQKAAEEVKA
ncbi:MAG TPA: hypothetical protein DHV24_13895, partial [Candidatus Margulisbacteria bacterium]|nr:hypothetical protein [Candidatus Margulisiibacteriota bacterium]